MGGVRIAPSDRVVMGFIGLGQQGCSDMSSFTACPGVQIAACCDVDSIKRERFRRRVTAWQKSINMAERCDVYEFYEDLLDRKDIDAVAIPVIDAKVFEMTDALGRRQMDQAFATLGDLFQLRQEPIMILAVLGKHFRQLYTARVALEARQSSRWLMELWGMRSTYPADKLMDMARRHGLDWCRTAMRRCAETDLAMKSVAGADPNDLLVSLMLELAAGGRAC